MEAQAADCGSGTAHGFWEWRLYWGASLGGDASVGPRRAIGGGLIGGALSAEAGVALLSSGCDPILVLRAWPGPRE